MKFLYFLIEAAKCEDTKCAAVADFQRVTDFPAQIHSTNVAALLHNYMAINAISVNDTGTTFISRVGDSGSDFDIRDDKGSAICTWLNGHIKTKNFDSEMSVYTKDAAAELSFSDENGNSVLMVSGGHIITQKFDSANIFDMLRPQIEEMIAQSSSDAQILQKFQGKRMAIIGDSISTFSGTMPNGYAVYYPKGDVQSVEQMYWAIVCQKLGMEYVNTAWSGSRVTGTAKNGSASAACSDQRVIDAGRNGNPDIILFYISCNDWGGNISVGDWKVSDPIDDTVVSANTLRDAYSLMLYKFQKAYPHARLYCCSNLDDLARDKTSGWPSNNSNGVSTHEWNQNIKEIAEALGAVFIDLHGCGINYANIMNYMVDSGLHPNAAGHKLMADYIAAQLIANY